MKTDEEIAAIRKKIGHRIKVRRVEVDLQQAQLGQMIGAPQSRISQWEKGVRSLSIDQAVELAAALQTTVGYLVGEQPRAA